MGLPERIANSPSVGTAAGLTTLSGSMTAGQASIPANAAAPAALQGTGQCRVLIDNELMVVDTSTTNGTTWTVITRGAEGTTATTHNAGATIYHVWTAGALQSPLYLPLIGVAQSGAFTARVGTMNYITGAQTGTLPAAPAADSEVGFVSLTGMVTVNRGGTDTISELGLTGQTVSKVPVGTSVVYKYLSGVWYPVRDARPLPSLTAARAYRNAALTPTNAAWVVIPLDAKSFDATGALWDTSNGWYTAPYPGYYRISGQISANYGGNNLTETGVAGIAVNGSLSVQGNNLGYTGGSQSALCVVSSSQQLAAGDHVQLAIYTLNTPGAGLTVGSADQNYLSVERIG